MGSVLLLSSADGVVDESDPRKTQLSDHAPPAGGVVESVESRLFSVEDSVIGIDDTPHRLLGQGCLDIL